MKGVNPYFQLGSFICHKQDLKLYSRDDYYNIHGTTHLSVHHDIYCCYEVKTFLCFPLKFPRAWEKVPHPFFKTGAIE